MLYGIAILIVLGSADLYRTGRFTDATIWMLVAAVLVLINRWMNHREELKRIGSPAFLDAMTTQHRTFWERDKADAKDTKAGA